MEKSSLPHFTALSHSLLSDSTFYNGKGKVEYRLDFSQRQWKSRVYLTFRTFSLHFSPTRLLTTAVEKSSLPHFTALSHFTSLRLDFLQRQWKSRVYLTFSLHFSPTRLFTTAVEKSSLPHFTALSHFTSLRLDFLQRQWKSRVCRTSPHFLTSLLSDSIFHNGSGKVESTSLSHFTSLRLDFLQRQWKVEYRLDFSQRQWKSRVYLTLPHFLTSLLSDSTFYNGSGKVEYRTRLFTTTVEKSSLPHFTALSHFTSLRLDFLQRQWKSRV